MKKLLMVFLLLALFPVVSSAQIDREVTRSVKVHFRQGAVILDENYMDNKATLSEFAKEVKVYYSDSTARFRQIRVVSSASPEGGKAINDRIAKQRAEAITQWISREIAVDLDYAVESTGIDWELLKTLIIEDEGVPYRDEVLELLERVPAIIVEDGKEIEVRYNELKALRNGTPYRWIYANIFPKLRYASACCEIWWETTPELLVDNTPVRLSADGGAAVIPFGNTVESYGEEHEVTVNQLGAEPKCKPFYMAIKTNMLYDVAAVPNIGAEFYLGQNFSIAANYAHAWWKKDAKNFYWRYYGADASLRWWFGEASRIKPLQGHHIGLNYQILTYDFQLGKKGIMAGMPNGNLADRANHIVALEYGYSLPIARRLNIDFSIGVGYHWGIFEEYIPVDGHNVWQATKRRQYFGPTKLEISLVWLIGCENYNKNKGSKR